MDTRKTILGISPGTTSNGIALFRNGDLLEYQVKTFTGKISNNKLRRIMNAIREIIESYGVNSIALKIPERKSSKEAQQIVMGIEKLAADKGLGIYTFSIYDLKQACLGDQKTNRQCLADHLMRKYPELSFVVHSGLNRYTYYGKMFEAIAAGMQKDIV